MSSARLNRLTRDAALNNDSIGMLQAYKEWQIANCYNPVRVPIYDAHQQVRRVIQVPCGTCYHCIESKINEWCTRMYAHAEDFKNVYFVTLTYTSFWRLNSVAAGYVLEYLKDALWHHDKQNSTKRLGWNPCVLCKRHYQLFLKRLRKNTGISDLTYVISGEYGHDYGRPHFHLILFTNEQITCEDIKRAWSVALWRKDNGEIVPRHNQKSGGKPFNVQIGHVDFHDLVQNGTFNTTAKIKVDGQFMNAVNCFGYVCKYVCKRDDVNYKRVTIAYNSLYKNVKQVKVLSNLNFFQYEKKSFQPDSAIYSYGLLPTKSSEILGHIFVVETLPSNYLDFRHAFRPFCEFSRGTPIGSVYAARHIREFTQDVFNKPLLQVDGFVVPTYFRRKASNYLYGLRKGKKSLFSASYNLSPLVNLYGRFSKSLETGAPLVEYLGDTKDYQDVNAALRDYRKHFADLRTGTKVVLYNNHAQHYKYNRHSRTYEFSYSVPLRDWLLYWCDSLRAEFVRHDHQVQKSEQNDRLRTDAIDLLQEFHGDFKDIRKKFVQQLNDERKHKQNIYHSLHKSVD